MDYVPKHRSIEKATGNRFPFSIKNHRLNPLHTQRYQHFALIPSEIFFQILKKALLFQ